MTFALLLQSAMVVGALPFGVLAVAIARRLRPAGDGRRSAWILTGICFSLIGVIGIGQIAFAQWAVTAGSDSAVWQHYLAWAPAANYARALAPVALAVLLAALAAGVVPPRLVPSGAGLIVLAAAAGALLGIVEGPFVTMPHLTMVAVITGLSVVLFLVALLAGLIRDTIDQLLWLALAAYTFKEALSVSLLAALAWLDHSRQVAPVTLYAMHSFAWLAIGVLALRRYHLATRGRYVPAIFERSPVRRRVMV